MKRRILRIDEYVAAENLFEAEAKELLEAEDLNESASLKEEYGKYFKETLESFGASSIGELAREDRSEFFKKIKEGWEKGKGRKGSEVNENEDALNEDDLTPGTTVKTKNGQVGKIDSWSDTTGKYIVILDGGETVQLGDDEVEAVSEASVNEDHIAAGSTVKCGDKTGTVQGYADGTYTVILDGGEAIECADGDVTLVEKCNEDDEEGDDKEGEGDVKEGEDKEGEDLDEGKVESDEDFKEYATKKLKAEFGDDFDQAKADETIEGLLKKKEDEDLDYGAIVGMLAKA